MEQLAAELQQIGALCDAGLLAREEAAQLKAGALAWAATSVNVCRPMVHYAIASAHSWWSESFRINFR